MKDFYQILEVTPDASQETIKEQYRFLVNAWHSDKFRDPAQKLRAEEKMKEINAAYEVLRDPAKRAKYDSSTRYTRANHQQEYRQRTTHQQSEKEQRREEEAARRAKEEQRQKEHANRERAEAEKRRAEDIRRQKTSQLDQEILLTEQEISKLNEKLPIMPNPTFGILFLVGGYVACSMGFTESVGSLFFLGLVSLIVAFVLFKQRNKYFREIYKPARDELEKLEQRLQYLNRERRYI